MGLYGVYRGLLPSFAAIQHPGIERESAAGQSQGEYPGILGMFGSTDSLALKGSFKQSCPGDGVSPCSLALQMQCLSGGMKTKEVSLSHKSRGALVYGTADNAFLSNAPRIIMFCLPLLKWVYV